MRTICLLLFLLTAAAYSQNEIWTVTGEMPLHVAGGEAVVRNDEVLILGGKIGPAFANVSVPIIQDYDPITREWGCPIDTSRICYGMLTPRADFMSGLIGDTVFYAGGTGEFGFFTTLEILTGTAIPGSATSNDQFNRSHANGLIHNNVFYMFGGYPISADSSQVSYIAAYNITTQNVTFQLDSTFQLFDAPYDQMVAAVGEDIYIFGGTRFGVLADVARFRTATNELEVLPPMPEVRAGGAAVTAHDGRIYIIGGYNETQTALSSVLIYDPAQEPDSAWSNGPDLNIARQDLMSVAYEDRIIVIGGYDAAGLGVAEVEELTLPPVAIADSNNDPFLQDYQLSQNFPNPFNGETTIRYSLPASTEVRIAIYNLNGELVEVLKDDFQVAGDYQISWAGTDMEGRAVSSGVYFYMLRTRYGQQTRKMILAQ